jgi:hypothetical protein
VLRAAHADRNSSYVSTPAERISSSSERSIECFLLLAISIWAFGAAVGCHRPAHPTALLYEVPVFVDPSEPNCCFLEMSLSLPTESSKQTLPPSPGSTTNDDAMLLLLDILRRAGWQVLELPLDATTLLQDLYKSNPDAVIGA